MHNLFALFLLKFLRIELNRKYYLFLVSKKGVLLIYYVGGMFMPDIQEEKRLIYDLLRKLIDERRELNKQYVELKLRLDDLNSIEKLQPFVKPSSEKNFSLLEQEKIRNQDYLFSRNKTQHHISFDRVSKNILAILKQSPIPLSNKQILEKLNKEYELCVSYKNLTCNILPKMLKERSLPIERAYRGYWQYHMPKL